MPLASVYPLVSSRAVARLFTYEVPDEVGKGAIVQVRLGRSTTRGVVVEVGVEPPPGIKSRAAGKVLDEIPPALVDLALWIADYYGTTPARALELVAPLRRTPRGERPSPAERESLPGEAAPAELTEEQSAAVARIVAGIDGKTGAHLLLVGPTGSGKTEVYLQACEAALARGLGTIVLVPEIALAPQTVGRFRERFGDTVAILHSALGQAERRDERDRVARGEARVVVGARSAIFAPMRDLGLVIVDEEHDSSYKQESDPRYDARTVAAKRAALEGAVAVYGSATPRPESWATLERVVLSARIGAPMPRVRIVDLRRESGYPLSAPLLTELGKVAEAGGKAILLLNRRGVTPAIHCRACGLSRRCGNCDVALTLHGDGGLHCHHCGHREPVPETCPACGSVELAHIGAGTQRLEKELERNVPELERIRLDADTAARPGALRETLERFRERGARRPDRHPDGREGAPLPGCRSGRRGRRRHGPRDPRLPRRGANVPARHPARRPERPRRSRARARADVPARRDAVPVRPAARRGGVPGRGAGATHGARLPAGQPPRHGGRVRSRRGGSRAGAARGARGARGSRGNAPRACAAPAPARPPPGPARREDPASRGRSPAAPRRCSAPRAPSCAGAG